jgi:hypothetical protein
VASISISKAWDETNALVRREAALLVPVALALITLPGVLIEQLRPAGDAIGAAAMLSQRAMLANGAGLLATLFASLVLTLLALRPGISVAEAMRGAVPRFPIAVGASLLLGLGLALLVAPVMPLLTGGEAAVQRLNPALALLLLIYLCTIMVVLLYGVVRLLLLNTVAAAEPLGVFATVVRSWALTRGIVSRLLGFVALFLALSLIVGFAAVAAGGTVLLGLGRLLGDEALGRLLLDIVASLVNTAFVTWLYLMLAAIYRQLGGSAGSNNGI